MSTATLGALLYAFFEHFLKAQKGVSAATVKSYRDAVRLFLLFVAGEGRVKLSTLRLHDLTAARLRRFLAYLEQERGNQVASRNQRLAALKTFFDFLATHAPEHFLEAEAVMAIPVKRSPPPPTLFLEREEMQTLLGGLPITGAQALRDRALLVFLYNTGARAQEVADLRQGHLELAQQRVRLHGKGNKWRLCPLWEETVRLLEQLLAQRPADSGVDRPVFRSQRGQALTRFGIYKLVRHHTQGLDKRGHDGRPVRISPHVLRHTAAVGLLEAGVEVNVIRAWLGHASLETTNRYAEITIAMKVAAMQACAPPIPSSEPGLPSKGRWHDDRALLDWLQSL